MKLTKKVIGAILVSFIGLIFVLGKTSGDIVPIGILLAFGAALSYSIYTLFGDHILKDIPLLITIAMVCLFAVLSFLTVGLVSNNVQFNFTLNSLLSVIGIAVVSMLGFLAFF